MTFAASANCVRYCGGEVVFCDIDKDTYLIDIKKLEDRLRKAPSGTYKGLILVDFAGYLPIRLISRTPTPTRSGSIPASFRGSFQKVGRYIWYLDYRRCLSCSRRFFQGFQREETILWKRELGRCFGIFISSGKTYCDGRRRNGYDK